VDLVEGEDVAADAPAAVDDFVDTMVLGRAASPKTSA
jgi:hypothetical protein